MQSQCSLGDHASHFGCTMYAQIRRKNAMFQFVLTNVFLHLHVFEDEDTLEELTF